MFLIIVKSSVIFMKTQNLQTNQTKMELSKLKDWELESEIKMVKNIIRLDKDICLDNFRLWGKLEGEKQRRWEATLTQKDISNL